jgi:hypothetical protein
MTAKGEAQTTVHIDTFQKGLNQYRNDPISHCLDLNLNDQKTMTMVSYLKKQMKN